MTSTSPGTSPHRDPRRGRSLAVLAALLVAAVLVSAGLASVLARDPAGTMRALREHVATMTPSGPAGVGPGRVGAADGRIGSRRVTIWQTGHPAVSGLDDDLVRAVRAATRAAEDDGIRILVTSGWRSRDYQQTLLDEAIDEYGGLPEARRWVSLPEESAHVLGAAIDVGPTDAAYWMSRHGAEHGLCQAYANEIWHYELLTEPGGSCPAPRADGAS